MTVSTFIISARKHLFSISTIGLFCLSSVFSSFSQSVLQAGDLAFLGYQSGFSATPTPKDRFAFVLLKPVDEGTRIIFNDNAVLQNNPLRLCRNESQAVWRATENLDAGQVVVITEGDTVASVGRVSGVIALAQAGDNITALQAVGADTSVIAAISTKAWLGTCATACGGTNNNVTCIPSPLVNGQNAISLGTNLNNAYFTPNTLLGTPSQILAQLLDPQNWTTSNGEQPWTAGYWGISVITSNKKSNSEDAVQLVPNPAQNFIQLLGLERESQFKIVDQLGKTVAQGFTNKGSKISVAGLMPGLYHLIVSPGFSAKANKSFSFQVQ